MVMTVKEGANSVSKYCFSFSVTSLIHHLFRYSCHRFLCEMLLLPSFVVISFHVLCCKFLCENETSQRWYQGKGCPVQETETKGRQNFFHHRPLLLPSSSFFLLLLLLHPLHSFICFHFSPFWKSIFSCDTLFSVATHFPLFFQLSLFSLISPLMHVLSCKSDSWESSFTSCRILSVPSFDSLTSTAAGDDDWPSAREKDPCNHHYQWWEVKVWVRDKKMRDRIQVFDLFLMMVIQWRTHRMSREEWAVKISSWKRNKRNQADRCFGRRKR